MSQHATWLQETTTDGDVPRLKEAEDVSAQPPPATPSDRASDPTRIVLPSYTDVAEEDVPAVPVGGDPLDASAFAPERMLRAEALIPTKGWRRVVFRLSGGHLNPGPSAHEQARAYLVAAAKTPIQGSRRIAVISRKGGVGKTTTTLMLGHTFATWRGDRVVALDGNPDAGSLGYRVRRETTATLTDLLNDAPQVLRYADIRAYTSQAPSRLEVVASDDDAQITQALGEDELADAIRLLDRHYNLILLDTGTGILDSATQGILRMTDQIVIVTVPSLDGARAASLTLDWLEHNGYAWLVRNAIAVMNQSRDDTLVDVERVEEHFQRRCRATVLMPYDPHLQAGAESDLNALAEPTRDAYLHLAAEVADGFRDPQRTPLL
jgi:putative peptide zinc metalloprotease protein